MTEKGSKEVITSPIKAIRAYCLACGNGVSAEVRKCPCVKCELYAFRFGHNPYRSHSLTEEQKAAMTERLKKSRLNSGNGAEYQGEV